jgi:N6-adenosine-specific RNA methylase IME4
LAVDNEWTVKEMSVAIRDAHLLDRPPLPSGVYNVIYADPPWQYGPEHPQGGPTSLHYPSMEIDELCAMDLPRIDDDAVLFMWVTNAMIRPEKAFTVLSAWGFEYKTNMVWLKTELTKPGSGYYVRGRHEFIFIATRGSFTPRDRHISPIGSYFEAPIGEHSEKPEKVYEFIESMYPNCSYIELFARKARDGWTSWGNEEI